MNAIKTMAITLKIIPNVFNLLSVSLKTNTLIKVPKTTIDMLFTGKNVEEVNIPDSSDFITKYMEKKFGIPRSNPTKILLGFA
jgi:hypothetical protein